MEEERIKGGGAKECGMGAGGREGRKGGALPMAMVMCALATPMLRLALADRSHHSGGWGIGGWTKFFPRASCPGSQQPNPQYSHSLMACC